MENNSPSTKEKTRVNNHAFLYAFICRLGKSFGRGNSVFVTVRLAHTLNLVIGIAPVERGEGHTNYSSLRILPWPFRSVSGECLPGWDGRWMWGEPRNRQGPCFPHNLQDRLKTHTATVNHCSKVVQKGCGLEKNIVFFFSATTGKIFSIS